MTLGRCCTLLLMNREVEVAVTGHKSTSKKYRPASFRKKKLLIILILVIAVAVGGLMAAKAFYNNDHPTAANTLPSDALQTAGFPVFFYPHSLPDHFHLVPGSVKYNRNYIIFQLTSPEKGQTVTVTEQSLPTNLATSSLVGKEKVEGTQNNTSISFDGSRMIGYMISKDKQTLAIINAPEGIEETTMKDLLRGLKKL